MATAARNPSHPKALKSGEDGMIQEDRFQRALENLHKAALAGDGLLSAHSSINDVISTTGHSFTYAEMGPGGEPEIHLSHFIVGPVRRVDLEQLYYRDYFWRDEAIPRLQGLADGEMVYKSDLYTDEEQKMSAAFNEFRCANQTQNGLFIGLHGLDGCGTVISFGNSTERQGWGHDQIQAVKRLAPHIGQFARVRHAMAEAKALGASLTELLDNRRLGIIQLDRRRRVEEANDRARQLLLQRDGLFDTEGKLAAQDQGENAELQCLLARAVPAHGLQGAGGSMKVTRSKARAPLVLEIHPVRGTGSDYRVLRVKALVLIVDPAVRPRVDPDLVAAVMGLTPAESRVAVALATGQTIAGVADALGCAASTVKTHLKRVYRKQGIRNQTELVRRVLALEGLRKSFR